MRERIFETEKVSKPSVREAHGKVKESVKNEDRYEKIKSKSVYDIDGFITDYTLYFDHNENNYFTVFGDSDLYGPEDEHDSDFGSNEDEALEWFEDYEGFIDDLDVDLELTDDDLEAGQWYESLNESFVDYDEFLEQMIWGEEGLTFNRDTPGSYEFEDSQSAKDALELAIDYGYKNAWRDKKFVHLESPRTAEESCNEKLIQSSSDKAFKKNVATEIKAGKDPKQAVAIAHSVKRKNESVKESVSTDAMNQLESDGWTVLSHGVRGDDSNYYWLARKMNKDIGKSEWKAINDNTGEVIDITYEQALGREPIGDSAIAKLSRRLGKALLPKRECMKESVSGYQDISDSYFQDKVLKKIKHAIYYYFNQKGYTNKEINDYFMPNIRTNFMEEYFDDGSDALFVDVGIELDYRQLSNLADFLDRVITKFDKEAYFEPVTSGILRAVIAGNVAEQKQYWNNYNRPNMYDYNLDDE